MDDFTNNSNILHILPFKSVTCMWQVLEVGFMPKEDHWLKLFTALSGRRNLVCGLLLVPAEVGLTGTYNLWMIESKGHVEEL